MWEDFGANRADAYLGYKFTPVHRIGLTNFLREEAIVHELDPQSTDSVLDVGCAAGRQLFQIADKIKEGHGTDIAQTFVDAGNAHARSKGITNVSLTQGVVEHLPFPDSSFDKVVCAEVLEHVYNKDEALLELRRVLKPGGILVITVPNMNADATWWGRLLRAFRVRSFVSLEQFSEEEIARHGDAHVREFTHRSLVDWVMGQGFTLRDVRSVSFIDGPYGDSILRVLLHFTFFRRWIINLEHFISRTGSFWGRHLVACLKKGD